MTVQAAAAPTPRVATRHRPNILRILNGEWIKITSLRSTWWSISIVAVLSVGIAVLTALAVGDSLFTPAQIAVMPMALTGLLAGILGAISVTGEYSTGMIRSTLAANPVRGSVLAAKAIVLAALMFLTSLIIFGGATLIVSAIMAPRGQSIDWSDAQESWLPILAASFSMAVFTLLGVAFGFILRSGAGAIAATVALLFVLPAALQIFRVAGDSWAWIVTATQYFPNSAAQSVVAPGFDLEVPVAYLTLSCWVVAGLLGAWVVLRSRDA